MFYYFAKIQLIVENNSSIYLFSGTFSMSIIRNLPSYNAHLSSCNAPSSSCNDPLSSRNEPLSSLNDPLSSLNDPLSSHNDPSSSLNVTLREDNGTFSTLNFFTNFTIYIMLLINALSSEKWSFWQLLLTAFCGNFT